MAQRTVERWLAILVAGLAVSVLLAMATTQAGPRTEGRALGAEAFMVDLVNETRVEHGLVPLEQAFDVGDVAWRWSAEMARTGEFDHNPHFATQVCCWEVVTENVAFSEPHAIWQPGDAVRQITHELHEALLSSPGHRANILDPGVDQVGIGIHVDARGSVWITQNFRRLAAD